MSADGCEVIQSDGDRTADGMAARWKLVRPEPATLRLEPSEPFWEVLEFTVQVERTVDSPGLGIMLEEYGSDDSGAGLTLVTGVVEGGNAAMASTALLPGDAIASACGANTEGLNYDGTIDALCSLPAAPAPAVLTVKRLRKVPVVTCTVMFPPDEGKPDKKVRFYEGRKVRQMLLMQGVEVGPQCNDDLQCCTSCGMLIRKGKALLEPMGSAERQMLAREPAWRLTCKSVVGPLEKDEGMTIRIRPDLENIMASRDEERAAARAARQQGWY